MVENIGNGIAHFSHGFLKRAGGLGGVRTVRTLLISRLTDTAYGSQWPVQNPDDLAERDVFRGFDEGVSAPDSTAARQQTGAFQGQEDLFEELYGDVLAFRNLMSLEDRSAVGLAEFEQSPQAVLTFL